MAFSAPAPAASARDETRELELLVSDHPKKAARDAQAWLAEGQRTRNRHLELKGLRLQALAFEQVEDTERLLEVALRGIALARELDYPVAEVQFLAARGTARMLEGKYADAARDYEDASRLALQNKLEDDVARVNINRSQLFLTLGRIPESLDSAMRAYSHFELRGDSYAMALSLSALANVHSRDTASAADLSRAAELHQRSLELLGSNAGRYDLSTDYFNLGTVYLRLKDRDKARGYFEKSLDASRGLEDPVGEAYVHHRLGTLAREQGQPKEALAFQDKALAVFKDKGNPVMELRTQLARAEVLSVLDRRKETLEALDSARVLYEKLQSPRLQSMLHEVAADIYARFGDYEKAFAETKALREAERLREEIAREERSAELQARFELRQKEAENALLRSRERESEARNLALVLSLLLSLVVLGALGAALAGYVMRHRQVSTLAARDDLTGIANRRSILEYARQQRRRRISDGDALTIAVIDLDHFKQINDDLGHAVGDKVLVAFAQTCTQQLRAGDRLGRFGGEEFLLVMPGADLAQVPYVFERLRRAMHDRPVEGVPADRKVTFSLGATEARGLADDLESLIQRADRALYRAKEAGRDRFETG
ncbi:GGDEF domain-containing protein [Usitatibacter palustris]|uniref:GGDEF domain-containing protein n=1 Tax=Usitatibacter palustris TaxID=2732487 RepID=UPI001487B7A5|nr:diguanylate cyclase [Usitatibacter palustris]